MRVAVLGASGFLGRHALPELVRAGHRVLALARRPPPSAPGVEPLAGDALDADTLRRALQGADAAVNLVGIHHGHGTQSFERVHVELPARLVEAMRAVGVSRLVHLSVLCARPDPQLAYHDSKHRGEEVVRQSGLAWTILRPAIVYGADDGFTRRIQRQIAQRLAPIPGKGDAPQQPVHADDVAAAIERALARPAAVGQTLPLTGLRTTTYAKIVDELAYRSGHPVFRPKLPLSLLRFIARATAWMASPPISPGQLAMISEGMAADSRAAWELLGHEPRGFDAAHLA